MLARNLIEGAAAGFAATAPMTAIMAGSERLVPQRERYPFPPYEITAKVAGLLGLWQRLDGRARLNLVTLAHLGYGAAAGAAVAALAPGVRDRPLAGGLGAAAAVWTAGYAGWLPLFRILPPPPGQSAGRNTQTIVGHIVWGLTLTGLLAAAQRRSQPRRPHLTSQALGDLAAGLGRRAGWLSDSRR